MTTSRGQGGRPITVQYQELSHGATNPDNYYSEEFIANQAPKSIITLTPYNMDSIFGTGLLIQLALKKLPMGIMPT